MLTNVTLNLASDFVFASQVLTNVCLVNYNDVGRVQVAALLGSLHTHTEAEGNISDAKNDDSDVSRGVLGDSSEMAFQNMVSVEESLFAVWLDPHFVLAVLGQIVKACDAQLEFPGLRELSENYTR